MRKIINGKMYSTDTARKIAHIFDGRSASDFNHFWQTLYLKKTGEFFLHTDGGPLTTCRKRDGNGWCGGEDITPYSEHQARLWLAGNDFVEEYIDLFGEVPE